MSNRQGIKYVKHNKARLRAGKREESTKMLLEFFNKLEGKVKGIALLHNSIYLARTRRMHNL